MSWRQKILGAVVLLLLVAVAARVAYELLAPLVPWLIAAVCLVGIYALMMGRFGR